LGSAYSTHRDPLAVFKGSTSKGKGRRGKGAGKGKVREGRGMVPQCKNVHHDK